MHIHPPACLTSKQDSQRNEVPPLPHPRLSRRTPHISSSHPGSTTHTGPRSDHILLRSSNRTICATVAAIFPLDPMPQRMLNQSFRRVIIAVKQYRLHRHLHLPLLRQPLPDMRPRLQ